MTKPLSLSKETLLRLSEDKASEAQGAIPITTTITGGTMFQRSCFTCPLSICTSDMNLN